MGGDGRRWMEDELRQMKHHEETMKKYHEETMVLVSFLRLLLQTIRTRWLNAVLDSEINNA